MSSAQIILREATKDAHGRVDAAFVEFSLIDRSLYRSFLRAHARALIPIETLLLAAPSLPVWRPRAILLTEDLAALDAVMPVPLAVKELNSRGNLHGMLYVLEGSRLGGGILSRRVGEGFPTAFLSATHQPGEWRSLLSTLDRRAGDEPSPWMDEAVAGARCAFELYVKAAEVEATALLRPNCRNGFPR